MITQLNNIQNRLLSDVIKSKTYFILILVATCFVRISSVRNIRHVVRTQTQYRSFALRIYIYKLHDTRYFAVFLANPDDFSCFTNCYLGYGVCAEYFSSFGPHNFFFFQAFSILCQMNFAWIRENSLWRRAAIFIVVQANFFKFKAVFCLVSMKKNRFDCSDVCRVLQSQLRWRLPKRIQSEMCLYVLSIELFCSRCILAPGALHWIVTEVQYIEGKNQFLHNSRIFTGHFLYMFVCEAIEQ